MTAKGDARLLPFIAGANDGIGDGGRGGAGKGPVPQASAYACPDGPAPCAVGLSLGKAHKYDERQKEQGA
jgi:hypothetical protein